MWKVEELGEESTVDCETTKSKKERRKKKKENVAENIGTRKESTLTTAELRERTTVTRRKARTKSLALTSLDSAENDQGSYGETGTCTPVQKHAHTLSENLGIFVRGFTQPNTPTKGKTRHRGRQPQMHGFPRQKKGSFYSPLRVTVHGTPKHSLLKTERHSDSQQRT